MTHPFPTRRSSDLNSGLSVSVAAFVVLVARLGPGVQQKVLAIEAGVNPAALVRTLDQGEAAGLLTRRDVPENRRIKVIDLLPEGQKLAQQMEASLAALRKKVLGDIPKIGRASFRERVCQYV